MKYISVIEIFQDQIYCDYHHLALARSLSISELCKISVNHKHEQIRSELFILLWYRHFPFLYSFIALPLDSPNLLIQYRQVLVSLHCLLSADVLIPQVTLPQLFLSQATKLRILSVHLQVFLIILSIDHVITSSVSSYMDPPMDTSSLWRHLKMKDIINVFPFLLSPTRKSALVAC